MSDNYLRMRRKYGAQYGLVAGLGFALFTWFFDAIGLASAHAAYPFLKLCCGLILTLPAFVLVAWLTCKTNSHLLGLFLWASLSLWAFTAAFLTQHCLLPAWYALMQEPVAALVKPSLPSYFAASLITVGAILMMFGFLLAGLLEINLIESALASSTIGARAMSALVVVVLMAIAGSQLDSFTYQNSRYSIQSFDRLIRLVNSPEGQALDAKTKTLRNFGAVESLGSENLSKPRRFFLIKDMPGEYAIIELFVQLGADTWGRCSASSRQASFCALANFN